MGILAMTSALLCLTVGAAYLLWTLLLHFEEMRTAAESGVRQRARFALLFLALAGVIVVGTLAVALVQVQQVFTPASL
jgi:hypothetical protein